MQIHRNSCVCSPQKCLTLRAGCRVRHPEKGSWLDLLQLFLLSVGLKSLPGVQLSSRLSKSSAPEFSRPQATDAKEMDSFGLGASFSMCWIFQVFVVKKPLSGTGGRPYFCEDELDPTYLHFVLSSHFSGSSWAEFGIGVGWASHPALSKAQGHGPGGTPTSLREKRKQDKWVPL